MDAVLKPNCLDEGLDDFLTSLLTQILYVSSASLVNLHLYSPDLQRGDRHLFAGDDGLLREAKELVAHGIQAGEPLIVTRLLARDRDCLPQVSRLREVGIEAVLVYPVQISPEHPLGRLIVFSRTPLDETMTKTIGAILENLVAVITLAIEAHNRAESERLLQLRWQDHGHRLRNHLSRILGRVGSMKREFPNAGFGRFEAQLEAFGKLTRVFEDTRRYFSDLPLSYLVESVITETVAAFDVGDRVSWSIDGRPVPDLSMRYLEAVAMVIGELATDSIKYAWLPGEVGEIHVNIQERTEDAGTFVVVYYSDDGQGLPIDFDPSTTNGTGLKLASEIAKGIGGKFELGRTVLGHGFSATLSFPV